MKNKKYLFVGLFVLAILPVYAASLLQPTSFPKTFNDVPFVDRMAVLAEDYANFDRLYDENGNCISGCPYAGINIKQDQQDVDEATAYFSDVIDEVFADADYDYIDDYDNNDYDNDYDDNDHSIDNDFAGDPDQNVLAPDKQDSQATNMNAVIIPTKDSLPLGSPFKKNSIIITSDFYFRTVKSVYGFHGGVDIGAPRGTKIYATGDGVVDKIGTDRKSSNGAYIKIRHAKGLYSWYMHLSSIAKGIKVGSAVKRGTYIGNSGGAKGDCARCQGSGHLDYRISKEKKDCDIWIDILCPCRATKKNARGTGYNQSTTASYNENVGEYQCVHSSFWRDDYYRFADFATKQRGAKWRVQSGHCMRNLTDKLPDEK